MSLDDIFQKAKAEQQALLDAKARDEKPKHDEEAAKLAAHLQHLQGTDRFLQQIVAHAKEHVFPRITAHGYEIVYSFTKENSRSLPPGHSYATSAHFHFGKRVTKREYGNVIMYDSDHELIFYPHSDRIFVAAIMVANSEREERTTPAIFDKSFIDALFEEFISKSLAWDTATLKQKHSVA